MFILLWFFFFFFFLLNWTNKRREKREFIVIVLKLKYFLLSNYENMNFYLGQTLIRFKVICFKPLKYVNVINYCCIYLIYNNLHIILLIILKCYRISIHHYSIEQIPQTITNCPTAKTASRSGMMYGLQSHARRDHKKANLQVTIVRGIGILIWVSGPWRRNNGFVGLTWGAKRKQLFVERHRHRYDVKAWALINNGRGRRHGVWKRV